MSLVKSESLTRTKELKPLEKAEFYRNFLNEVFRDMLPNNSFASGFLDRLSSSEKQVEVLTNAALANPTIFDCIFSFAVNNNNKDIFSQWINQGYNQNPTSQNSRWAINPQTNSILVNVSLSEILDLDKIKTKLVLSRICQIGFGVRHDEWSPKYQKPSFQPGLNESGFKSTITRFLERCELHLNDRLTRIDNQLYATLFETAKILTEGGIKGFPAKSIWFSSTLKVLGIPTHTLLDNNSPSKKLGSAIIVLVYPEIVTTILKPDNDQLQLRLELIQLINKSIEVMQKYPEFVYGQYCLRNLIAEIEKHLETPINIVTTQPTLSTFFKSGGYQVSFSKAKKQIEVTQY